MKLAYLVLAHNNLEQLALLVNTLAHPRVSFIIHLDSKIEVNLEALRGSFAPNANVFFLDYRIAINWGGNTMLEAIISLIIESLNHDNYDYVSLISGNDFPIKTSEEILNFLSSNKGTEYIAYHKLPFENWPDNRGQDRYHYYWLIDEIGFNESRLFVEAQREENSIRQFPAKMVAYGGSMWFTITTDCALYIYSSLKKNPKLLSFFRYVMIPDEMAIQTIILNSKFKKKVENNNLRYIDWSAKKTHPKTLTIEDLPAIQKSGCHLARKFDLIKDKEIIEQLVKSLNC
jgi:hypothetical protein